MAIGNPVSLTSQVASKTISIIATASQTAFTVTGGYRINQLAVFRNGVRLVDSRDYEARDGATVTLLSAASDGDAMEFQVFDAFQVADTINPYSTYQTIDGNLNITGIVTAATFSITDLDVRNITGVAATFTGQVTYEDVTNVDAIGLSTFRAGINVTGGSVGIGTTNPGSFAAAADRLVVGNGSGSQGISIYAGTSGESGVYFVDSVGGSQGQIFYRHSNDSLAFVTNNGAAALNIDSSGRLLVGTTTPRITEDAGGFGADNALIQIEGAGSSTRFSIIANSNSDATRCATVTLGRSRGTAVSSNDLIQNGDRIGAIVFSAADGTDIRSRPAQIFCEIDGTPSGNDTPGRLVLSTTADSAASPTERLRITSGGQVNIGGNYTQTTYTMQVTGTINATSNITQNGNALATNGKAIAMALIFG